MYGIDFASGSRRHFLPLTAPDLFRLESNGGTWSVQADPSSDSESGGKQINNASPATSETLADVLERSNQRLLQPGTSAAPGETAVTVAVDDALKEKPLEVFGAEGMSPAALAESVSRLYNLRVTRVTASEFLLTRRARIGTRDIASLAPAVLRSTPSPLVRYIYGRSLQRTEKETQRLRDSGCRKN